MNDIISKDSTNSSKPPSTDNKFKEVKKPSTKKLKKRRGAQAGHKGKNLKLSATPGAYDSAFYKSYGTISNKR